MSNINNAVYMYTITARPTLLDPSAFVTRGWVRQTISTALLYKASRLTDYAWSRDYGVFVCMCVCACVQVSYIVSLSQRLTGTKG